MDLSLHDISFPVSAADLLPHEGPMRLVDALLEHSEERERVQAVIEPAGLFCDATGRLSRAGLVEILAQSVAAGAGYQQKIASERPPAIGYLVGMKDVSFSAMARAGDTLEITLQKGFKMESFAFVDGAVTRGDTLLAAGTLKLYTEEKDMGLRAGALQACRACPPVDEALRDALQDFSIRQEAGALEARGRFTLHADFPALQGHFPGYPILPGVVLLETGRMLAAKTLKVNCEFQRITQVKFRAPVFPGDSIDLSVRLKPLTEKSWNFLADVQKGNGRVCRIQADLEEAAL